MKTVLIVGKNFSGLKNSILSSGYDYILLQDIITTKYPNKKFKKRVLADFSDINTVYAAIDGINQKIDGAITVYEGYVYATSQICEYIGVPGLPLNSAKACTDKYIMRQLFAKSTKKISPECKEVFRKEDLISFAKNHDFPLILKPTNLVKSLLVTKSNNLEELITNYNETLLNINKVYKKYAPNQKPKLIIEEFMNGDIHSVDVFVDKKGTPFVLQNVVDYQTGYDIGYDDNFHYSRIIPSKLAPSEIKEIREVAALGCESLGIKNSPAHVEIIRTKNGPMIVEIGARNGGYRDKMHQLANGIDITGNAVALCLGQKPNITVLRNDCCAVLELFPKNAGIFTGISNEEHLKKLASFVNISLKQTIGSFVDKSSKGYKMCAIIVLHNNNKNQFQEDLEYINSNVHVVTK